MESVLIVLLLVGCAFRWAYVEWWKHRITKALPRLEQVIATSTPAHGAEVVRGLQELI